MQKLNLLLLSLFNTKYKWTYCSWPRLIDQSSPSLHRTSSCCGCSSRSNTQSRDSHTTMASSPEAYSGSFSATRLTRRYSPHLRRRATGQEHTSSCCTGRTEGCRRVRDRTFHLSRRSSRFLCRRQTSWIYTGRWRTETDWLGIVSQLRSGKTEGKNVIWWWRWKSVTITTHSWKM